MLDLPLTYVERERLRLQILDDLIVQARQQAVLVGRSIKCGEGQHADKEGGCANDGATCLCDCHDKRGDDA